MDDKDLLLRPTPTTQHSQAFLLLLTISDQNITQETHRCQILTLSERDIYWHDKTMEYLVPICLVLGNLIDPQGESHLRIPQSQIS